MQNGILILKLKVKEAHCDSVKNENCVTRLIESRNVLSVHGQNQFADTVLLGLEGLGEQKLESKR